MLMAQIFQYYTIDFTAYIVAGILRAYTRKWIWKWEEKEGKISGKFLMAKKALEDIQILLLLSNVYANKARSWKSSR